MKDNEIIEALGCCIRGNQCAYSCPYDDEEADCNKCTSALAKDTLDLINRKDAEIERLKAVTEAELESMHNLGDDYENALEEISRLKAKIEKLENGYRLHLKYISALEKEQRNVQVARCEAVKGFALLVNRRMFRGAKHAYERSYIDNLAVEWVGDE